MALPPKVYQFLVGLFASLGSLLYGYDLGVIAQVIASKAFIREFNQPDDNATGAVVSVFTGGAFFGAAFAGPAGDKFGRRITILMGALVRIAQAWGPISPLLTATAQSGLHPRGFAADGGPVAVLPLRWTRPCWCRSRFPGHDCSPVPV